MSDDQSSGWTPLRIWSLVGLIVFLAVFIGLDVWFAADDEPTNTWSEIIRKRSLSSPFFPWFWGILAGRFFHWRKVKLLLKRPGNYFFLGWLTVLLIVVGEAFHGFDMPIPPWVFLVPAYFAGALLFPVAPASVKQ